MGSAPDPDLARLLEVIADSDDAIRVGSETPEDPVAVRVVVRALISKGRALSKLERFEESVPVWDQLLAHRLRARTRFQIACQKLWDLACNPGDRRIPEAVDDVVALFDELERPRQDIMVVADALTRKSYVLELRGHVEQATCVEAEILDQFSADPEAAAAVSWALGHRILRLLKTPGSLDVALAASEQLGALLRTGPDETLALVASPVERSIQALTGIAAPSLSGVATLMAVTLVNISVAGWRTGHGILDRRAPQIAALLSGPRALEVALSRISVVHDTRERFGQALVMCDLLIERIGDSDDAELRRSAAMAKIYRGVTLTGLGHIRDGFSTFGSHEASGEPGAAAAYQEIADTAKPPGWLKGLGVGSALSLRAAALGGSDAAITQLAYDEAVRGLPAEIREGRLNMLAIRLLRPGSKTKITVPDHPPKPSPK